jgi:hypothetical protein
VARAVAGGSGTGFRHELARGVEILYFLFVIR